jgi:hypothetical protein
MIFTAPAPAQPEATEEEIPDGNITFLNFN